MARALWRGTINFGLVAMPVELMVVDHSNSIDLDMLDKRDNARIHFKRVNATTGKEVTWKNIVKGYKAPDGDYVIITDEDFRKANVKATQTIDIQSFVNLDDVDVVYFEKPYYLKATKGGEKPYALLYKTLLETGKIGIATIVIRKKQHLAAVMPKDGILVLEIMRFPDEIRDRKEMDLPRITAKVSPREVKMAKDLVASMSAEWEPGDYKDTYHDDLMKMIKYKIKHGKTKAVTEEAVEEESDSGNVVDLMPLLRKSLESSGSAHSRKKRVKRGTAKVL